MNIETHFFHDLQAQNLIPEQSRLLVACSGGPDSTALFHLLRAAARTGRYRLALVHLNHGLRKRGAQRDERFVRDLGKRFDVPVFSGRKKITAEKERHESWEEAARRVRYDFITRVAKRRRYKIVVLGHTQDDQAETVLMRLFQGSGLRGLSGIRASLKRDGVTYVRPLLNFTKKNLIAYLKDKRYSYCRDGSNQSKRFVRNRVRLDFLPWIAREINPRIVETLARVPKIVGEENEMIRDLEARAWKKVLKRGGRGKLSLHRDLFSKMPGPLQFRILDRALKRLDVRSGAAFDSWQNLRRQLARRHYKQTFPRNIEFCLTPGALTLYRRTA
ncbi:MAG: tRNA lysidine(34) synthetase TilS [Omnitrophica bacterium GWA2_52_8]|nr:MAG: tRNA lysidine(34) synthetase TilS [Omnitrophica bacterium GWA2_52_8]